mmetsp:Transcript_7032/g.8052  ORF Transcript_7032/g.8052 Transcript_7032/m.8052 type:complete len:109 (+) Transcript_7032:1040-1366(+)
MPRDAPVTIITGAATAFSSAAGAAAVADSAKILVLKLRPTGVFAVGNALEKSSETSRLPSVAERLSAEDLTGARALCAIERVVRLLTAARRTQRVEHLLATSIAEICK